MCESGQLGVMRWTSKDVTIDVRMDVSCERSWSLFIFGRKRFGGRLIRVFATVLLEPCYLLYPFRMGIALQASPVENGPGVLSPISA